MVCSTNGERLDHPGAHLVVLRLLLTESGHYILPINHNQKDLELTEMEKLRVKNMMQGPQEPCRSATLEQSGMSGISGISEPSVYLDVAFYLRHLYVHIELVGLTI